MTADFRFLTLLGIKHVGKTTVARALLAQLEENAPDERVFLWDTDGEMVSTARKQGILPDPPPHDKAVPPIRRLYTALGEEQFHSLEADVLETIRRKAESHQRGTHIVATGGGVASNPRGVRALEKLRPLLYLWNDPEVLYDRIAARGIPPFLHQEDPRGSFLRMAAHRDAVYRSIADTVMDIAALSIRETAQRIFEEMR